LHLSILPNATPSCMILMACKVVPYSELSYLALDLSLILLLWRPAAGAT